MAATSDINLPENVGNFWMIESSSVEIGLREETSAWNTCKNACRERGSRKRVIVREINWGTLQGHLKGKLKYRLNPTPEFLI